MDSQLSTLNFQLSTLNFQLSTLNFQFSTLKRQLHFKQPARTSRGEYAVRDVWYVKILSDKQPGRWGIGECAPLPDLSCDFLPDYEQILADACRHLEQNGCIDTERLRPYPSVLFGLETAVRHFEAGSFALWDTPFAKGKAGIPINGLIWMDDYPNMLKQIETKIAAGFRCIKLKIGATGFEEELALLRHIRNRFPAKDIELRVDANGAFTTEDAPEKLNRLAELDIHSIEQPVRAGQWEAMADLIFRTPLPIALDEELIGIHRPEEKRRLLTVVRPQYIVLKPSLHGGFCGCNEWIEEAGKLGIGWWMTSALESNIGLNAIAQRCATYNNPLPQGLGTGQLFTDNIHLPLFVRDNRLWYEPNSSSAVATAETAVF
jgi:o-succinylbenzoate synthase